MGQQISEITLLGIFGLDQISWGGEAGAFYECWKVSPCCGSPDVMNVLWCLLHWYLCTPCSSCKLYATSLGDQCSLWPHCFCYCFTPCCARIFTRYNLRKKNGTNGNIIGDCVCVYFCNVCACCQELRSVSPDGWRIFPEITIPGIMGPACKFLV